MVQTESNKKWGKQVLVVSVEPSWLLIVKVVTGAENVATCTDPTLVLPMLKTGTYGRLITDLSMPTLSGLELLTSVRRDAELKDFPVLVVFHGPDSGGVTTRQLLAAGATLAMTKDEFYGDWKKFLK